MIADDAAMQFRTVLPFCISKEQKGNEMTIKAKITRIVNGLPVLRAISDILIDDAVLVHNILLSEAGGEYYVFMPYRTWTDEDGKTRYFDVVELMTDEIRQKILHAVVEAYDSVMKEKSNNEGRENNV